MKEYNRLQSAGMFILILCMGFGMFAAGWKQGQEAKGCDCQKNVHLPEHEACIRCEIKKKYEE